MTSSSGTRLLACLLSIGFFAVQSKLSCAEEITIPASTPLPIELVKHVPMKVGEALNGRLLYSVYAGNQLAIPAGSLLAGSVIRLKADRVRRIRSRLRGDFTPFHIPVVRFDRLTLPDGSTESISSNQAADGAPLLHLSTPGPKTKRSLVSQQIAQAKQSLKEQVAVFTAPGKRDRLVQFVYSQLPYHPERIASGTLWTVELAQPVNVDLEPHPADPRQEKPAADAAAPKPGGAAGGLLGRARPGAGTSSADSGASWHLRAYLSRTISSASDKPGDTFQAMIAEPVFDPSHVLEVPQGALLIGTVTQAKPARSFGRKGKLRFSFRELKLPNGFSQGVQGNLTGTDSNASANLQIDSEGGVQPKSQNRVIVPLLLGLLASRAFDTDGNQAGNGAVASNGFGLVGRIAGIVAGSRNVAAGIGFYGTALALYDRWLARGHDVVFTKDTRIEVATTPGRTTPPVPEGKSSPAPR